MAKNSSNVSINLSAIAYREGGIWLAHCLELDIVAEGDSFDDSVRSLVSLCDFQIKVAMEAGDLQSIFRPAPSEAWTMFSSGREKIVTDRKTTRRKRFFRGPVDRFEARQIAFA